MAYCVNCGYELQNEWNVCPSCGTAKHQTSNPIENLDSESGKIGETLEKKSLTTVKYREALFENRSKGLAVLLTLLIPGAGHLYTDRVFAGLGYFFLNIMIVSAMFAGGGEEEVACLTLYILFYIHVVVDSVSPV